MNLLSLSLSALLFIFFSQICFCFFDLDPSLLFNLFRLHPFEDLGNIVIEHLSLSRCTSFISKLFQSKAKHSIWLRYNDYIDRKDKLYYRNFGIDDDYYY